MKKVFYLITTLFICLFGVVGIVNADTSKCTSELKNSNNKAANAITASYDFVYDDNKNVKGFSINVYNVPSNMTVIYKTSPDKFNISGSFDLKDGQGSVEDANLTDIYNYNLEIYSTDSGCNYKVKTLKVVKPMKNEYSDSVYCLYSELEDNSLCQEWITKSIGKSKEEVEDMLQKMINKTTTTTGEEKCVDCDGVQSIAFSIKDFIKRNKIVFIVATILAIILDIFTIVLLAKNSKEGEL